jgi:hypothetical protein
MNRIRYALLNNLLFALQLAYGMEFVPYGTNSNQLIRVWHVGLSQNVYGITIFVWDSNVSKNARHAGFFD